MRRGRRQEGDGLLPVSVLIQRPDEADRFPRDSLDCLRSFPADVRTRAGFELREVQKGYEPTDWKPMTAIGSGAREIRVRGASGAFRILYIASIGDAVLVLHAFQKKTQQTAKRDIDLAIRRLKAWRSGDANV